MYAKRMSNRVGYARVSTDDQNLDLQRDALTSSGCVNIYEETVSGKLSNIVFQINSFQEVSSNLLILNTFFRSKWKLFI